MIDLTPLDVRKKSGDFTKSLRGYDPQQVDSFLELAAERLEELVKENLALKESVERLSEQVEAQTGREKAVNDALVSAQKLREDIAHSAEREADAIRAEARAEVERMHADAEASARKAISEAETRLADLKQTTRELTRRRARFLASFRQMLERELDMVEVQEADTVEEYMVVGLGLDSDTSGPTASVEEGGRTPDEAALDPDEAEKAADEAEQALAALSGAHGQGPDDAVDEAEGAWEDNPDEAGADESDTDESDTER